MKVNTTQVSAADALRAIADGKNVQMMMTGNDRITFSDLNAGINSLMSAGDAFLVIETEEQPEEQGKTPSETYDPELTDDTATVRESREKPAPKGRKSVDNGKIAALRNAGWSPEEIAQDMHISVPTVYQHLRKLKEKGKVK